MRIDRSLNPQQLMYALQNGEIHLWEVAYRRELGRAQLASVLGRYIGTAAKSIVFVDGEHGRPELAEAHRGAIEFNWSHSGDRALVAVSKGVVPGVDIERIRPRPRAMQLAQRYFHPDEIASLCELGDADRERAFVELWTAKEAVLKALGRGLAFGLHRLNIAVKSDVSRLLWLDDDLAAAWQLIKIDHGREYVSSLAWRGPARSVRLSTLADRE